MSFRDDNLTAIEALVFPEGWKKEPPRAPFHYERYWFGTHTDGSSTHLKIAAQGGRNVIEVSGFAVTILCGADRVQEAVDTVLKWGAGLV